MESDKLRPVVGKKQILRFTKENELKYIQIATDAEEDYKKSIAEVAVLHNVKVVISGTMQEIAAQHGINVPCGAVGFFKN